MITEAESEYLYNKLKIFFPEFDNIIIQNTLSINAFMMPPCITDLTDLRNQLKRELRQRPLSEPKYTPSQASDPTIIEPYPAGAPSDGGFPLLYTSTNSNSLTTPTPNSGATSTPSINPTTILTPAKKYKRQSSNGRDFTPHLPLIIETEGLQFTLKEIIMSPIVDEIESRPSLTQTTRTTVDEGDEEDDFIFVKSSQENQAPSSLLSPVPNQSFLYPSVEQTYSETPKLTKDAVISPVDLFHHTDQIIQQNLSPSHGDIPMIRKFLLRKCNDEQNLSLGKLESILLQEQNNLADTLTALQEMKIDLFKTDVLKMYDDLINTNADLYVESKFMNIFAREIDLCIYEIFQKQTSYLIEQMQKEFEGST